MWILYWGLILLLKHELVNFPFALTFPLHYWDGMKLQISFWKLQVSFSLQFSYAKNKTKQNTTIHSSYYLLMFLTSLAYVYISSKMWGWERKRETKGKLLRQKLWDA